MSVLDMLARAETSSDLAHHEYACSVDVLGATGMAHTESGALSIFRFKYYGDQASKQSAKDIFILWTRRAMLRRKLDASGASRLGTQILTSWCYDICQPCGGLGYPMIESTPTLSSKKCTNCKGTGRNMVNGNSLLDDVKREVQEKADDAIIGMQRRIKPKLGDKE